jgi:hypothetical protein
VWANVKPRLCGDDCLNHDGFGQVAGLPSYLGDPDSSADPDAVAVAELWETLSRSLGGRHLLDGLWEQPNVAMDDRWDACNFTTGQRFTEDLERLLFALVAKQPLDPKIVTFGRRLGGPRRRYRQFSGLSNNAVYRTRDLLVEADATAQMLEAGSPRQLGYVSMSPTAGTRGGATCLSLGRRPGVSH